MFGHGCRPVSSCRDSELVHAASKEAVTDSSGGQNRLWRAFYVDRITLCKGGWNVDGIGYIDEGNLASAARTSEYAG